MTSAADLFGLQEIDLKHDSRRALLADIGSRLCETEELIEARAEKASAVETVAGLQQEQKQIEVQLEDLDAKVTPLETKLYDGSIRNPKELGDIQKEVGLQKERRGVLDDAGLATLERIEFAGEEINRAGNRLRQVEAAWNMDQDRLRAERAVAEQDSNRLEQDRAARSQGMDASSLGLYEKLRETRQGRAVARIERGSCQGCRISLPTHVVQRVRGQVKLEQCPSCERILVAG